jgi:Protein of unknown function (DUF1264)
MVIVASIAMATIGAGIIGAGSIDLLSNKANGEGTGAATNNTAAPAGIPSNVAKNMPVTGYDTYNTAIKHVYNDPNLKVGTFCKPGVRIVATCQIYDGSSPTARLIGIEYIITAKDYNTLPTNEKPNWYVVNKALGTTVQARFPGLNTQQINAIVQHLAGNYGKMILTWNPLDNVPASEPRTENLQNLFVVNQTSTNSTSTTK